MKYIFAYAATLLMTLTASVAHSGIVSVQFSGTIRVADDGDGFLARAGVVNGDLVNGMFSYDTAAVPWSGNAATALSQYWPIDYSFTIGGNKVLYEWVSGGSGIIIRDDFSSIGDMFNVSLSGNLVNTATTETHYLSSTNSWIADNTGTAWSGSALPSNLLLADLINPSVNPGYQAFSRMSGTNLDYSVRDFTMQVLPVAEVSAPATLPLLGLSFAALMCRHRKTNLSRSR